MHTTIIVPVFRRTAWIGRCLEKLCEQNTKTYFDVVIVDDGSPNQREMGELIDNLKNTVSFPLKYLATKHGGPAAARNFGVRASSADILCFLDDDSLPDSNWLWQITEPFSSQKGVGLVSGCILSLDRTDLFPLLLEKAVYSGKSWATCNIAYRRDIFDALGGFDERFPDASWEDNDLGLRARWAGFQHVHNNRAVVYHPHEATLQEYRKKCLLNGRGAAVFSRKYLLKKPLWGIATPFLMARRLIYGLLPSVWFSHSPTISSLRFYWSLYSLQGFIQTLFRSRFAQD